MFLLSNTVSHLRVIMSSGICVPATTNVMTNSMSMKGLSVLQSVCLHTPLVASGDMVTSDPRFMFSRMQAQSV